MDTARSYFRPELRGFEHLHAHFERYRYARHAHSRLVIGLVDQGIQSYTYRGARHLTGPDGIFFVNAGEAHTGEPADGKGYTYRGIQIAGPFIENLMGGAGTRELAFTEAVVYSKRLAGMLRSALLAVENSEPALLCEELILNSLRAISRHYAHDWKETECRSPGHEAINRARDFIEQSRMEDLSLALLGSLTGLSVFHFAHSFRQQVGSSPFMYAEAVRIGRAKRRLSEGAGLADVAFELGYTDQSHFSRRFKQHEGITPGQYRLSVAKPPGR